MLPLRADADYERDQKGVPQIPCAAAQQRPIQLECHLTSFCAGVLVQLHNGGPVEVVL